MLFFTSLFGGLMLLTMENRRRTVAILLIGCIAILGISPPPAQAQFGCLPCAIQTVLTTINQTIGKWLNRINMVATDIQKFHEETIWPIAAIRVDPDGNATVVGGTPVFVLPHSEFPRFVESRFDMREGYQKKKDKKSKIKSPWWNLAQVAMKARGNQIGRITNLISDCIAAGRSDYAYELVDQLQNALDSLKHNVQVDQEVIKRIRNEVPRTAWLQTKEAKRISDMPMEVPIAVTDIVGQLYNHVRKEIGILFEDVLPLRDFGGMIRGETFTREMYEECQKVNRPFLTLTPIPVRTVKVSETAARPHYAWYVLGIVTLVLVSQSPG